SWRYAASLAGGHTDNERPNNSFDSFNLTARVDRAVTTTTTLGGTLRGFHGEYGSPGTIYTSDPDNEERESNWLGTGFAEFAPAPDFTARVTLGGQARRFVSENPSASGTTQITEVTNRRGVLDAQATYTGVDRHRLTAGTTLETNHTRNTGFGDINERQNLVAVFVQDQVTVTERLFLTAGLRSDDHDTFGRATTGRATVAWQAVPARVKLRASYGTAFRSPSFLDLYGESPFYVGNPDLDPERALGWDAGVDVYWPGDRGTLSVTWFDTRFRDLIVFDFGVFPGTTANVSRARTRGLEVSSRLVVGSGTELKLGYGYLEADDLSAGTRLLRRPRHTASVDLMQTWAGGWDAGIGVVAVANRTDVHAQTFETIDADDYVVARIYASWAINARIKLRARVENALDRDYEQVHGYPQPGFGAYVGAEWTF
ncbi:MAG TPA: TonB-dependent receptor, partial [Candidatus Synoicihabitans sp.]|nr:TonB-dependent receptor [Candidatus Synoicihabitans sp.]